MLNPEDNNIKEGNYIVYTKEFPEPTEPIMSLKNRFTLNRAYQIINIQGFEQVGKSFSVIIVKSDIDREYGFALNSKLSDCFETIQDIRKRKLIQLENV